MIRPLLFSFLLACSSVAAIGIRGQTAADERLPTFEVASVKRNTSGSISVNHSIVAGRYVGTNLSVADMLAAIYTALPRSRITGGPAWMRTDRFDIVAKAVAAPPAPEIFRMLHALLQERFKLSAHTEEQEGDVYNLILARSDGRLGPMLRQSPVDCAAQRRNARPASDAGARSQAQTCRANNYPGRIIRPLAMAELAGTLAVWADGRDVRDRTGLTGTFDVDLTWTPDRLGPLPLNAPPDLVRAREAIDPNGPSLFTAVQEQLGLKLEPKGQG